MSEPLQAIEIDVVGGGRYQLLPWTIVGHLNPLFRASPMTDRAAFFEGHFALCAFCSQEGLVGPN